MSIGSNVAVGKETSRAGQATVDSFSKIVHFDFRRLYRELRPGHSTTVVLYFGEQERRRKQTASRSLTATENYAVSGTYKTTSEDPEPLTKQQAHTTPRS